jgi:phosphate-selective porin OprO and OprP
MHQRFIKRSVLAFLFFIWAQTNVLAQAPDNWTSPNLLESSTVASQNVPIERLPVALASYSTDERSLQQRVAELEAALAKIEANAAAKKTKAANSPSVKVGGRIHFDINAFDQDAVSRQQAEQHDAVGFRRVRIKATGDLFHTIDYKVECTFNKLDPDVRLNDVYMTYKELPFIGNIRVGHMKEPFGLNHLCSSNNLTLMERALNCETYIANRNLGFMFFDNYAGQRGTWAIGGFSSKCDETGREFNSIDSGGLATTGRITYLPWYDEASGGQRFLHTGVGYSYRDVLNKGGGQWGPVQFQSRPEAYFANSVVDTGKIYDITYYQVANIETALENGPFSIQAEWFRAFCNRAGDQEELAFGGCYGQVSYFLTGEHRPYNLSSAKFGRVIPHENFFCLRTCDGSVATGLGAWEIAYRYSYLDLNSMNIDGGRVGDHTLGLNWYLNPFARIMFNYVQSTTWDDYGKGNLNIFETRFQLVY